MRIRKSIVYDIMLMGLFLLFDRTFNIYYLDSNLILKTVYARASQICVIFVMLIWFLYLYKQYRSNMVGGLFIIALFYGELLFSTLLNNGSVYTVGMVVYPILGICMLTGIACRTKEKMMHFIHVIAVFYFIITAINFILLPVSARLFPENQFFLGGKNQLGYSLNMGLLFCILDEYFNRRRLKFIFYLIMYCITMVAAFSGSNIVGMIIILAFLFVRPLTYLLQKIRFFCFLLIYAAIFIGVVFMRGAFFQWGPIKYLIVDILGKDMTLTNRTYIWAVALKEIATSPGLGHGMSSTENLFHIDINVMIRGTLSAHNQVLQTLYEGGAVGISIIVIFLLICGIHMHRIKDKKIAILFITFILATLVMLMGEAPGWNALLYIMNLLMVISGFIPQEKKSTD